MITVDGGGSPSGIFVDKSNNVYFIANNKILLGKRTGPIVVAGTGAIGSSGDGGKATNALLNIPQGITVDTVGNVFVADTNNNKVRKISVVGIITTYAGTGTRSNEIFFGGDGGAATSAEIDAPRDLALDGAGNLFMADYLNSKIRRVTSSGIITTFAGYFGWTGYGGDGGAATSAFLSAPNGIAFDTVGGNLYIADTQNNIIRKVTRTGIITTYAGIPKSGGYSGDGGSALNAQLGSPQAVAWDINSGNLYISDVENNNIRLVTSDGIISTYAGLAGDGGNSGDGGPATNAQFYNPSALALNAKGSLLTHLIALNIVTY